MYNITLKIWDMKNGTCMDTMTMQRPFASTSICKVHSHGRLTCSFTIYTYTTNPLLKMPPYFDGPHYDRAAKVLNQYSHVVKYVASINTVGNCLSVDPIAEMPAIRSNGGFAGLSGR
jgi:dihydroorotate dehydrogenase